MLINLSKSTRLSFKVQRVRYNLWIGGFYNARTKAWFVCLLPTLPIVITRQTRHYCKACGEEVTVMAMMDEGWILYYECDKCFYTEEEFQWPLHPDTVVSGEELEQLGYQLR